MSPYGAWPPPPPPPKSNGGLLIGLGIALIALLFLGAVGAGGAFYFVSMRRASAVSMRSSSSYSSSSSGGSGGWSDAASPIPVTSADPSWGEREAPITIVVFGDFEDPFAALYMPSLESVKTSYGPAVVRVLWKNAIATWHPHAHEAAEAAYGCFDLKGEAAFWHFEEQAFANHKSLASAAYETWASESFVDLVKFRDGMTTHKWAAKVDEDDRLAKSLHIYTGSVYVNGIKVSGPSSLASWQKTIDDELPKARAALASGVAGNAVYVNRSTANFATVPPAPTSTYAPPVTSTAVHRVPIGTSPIRGKTDALVTIVEFADFQCPFCGRAEKTLEAVRLKYGTDLRIVWKNEPLPFHVHALPAAELAYETRAEKGDATFWVVHDEIYASQTSGLDDTALLGIARTHGVSESAVRTAISTKKYQPIFDADHTLATSVGALGTPNFFINGRQLSGAQPQSTFETVIDEELKKARDLVTKGTPRAKVYDEIMSTATL